MNKEFTPIYELRWIQFIIACTRRLTRHFTNVSGGFLFAFILNVSFLYDAIRISLWWIFLMAYPNSKFCTCAKFFADTEIMFLGFKCTFNSIPACYSISSPFVEIDANDSCRPNSRLWHPPIKLSARHTDVHAGVLLFLSAPVVPSVWRLPDGTPPKRERIYVKRVHFQYNKNNK